jgi:hypothetical protein
MTSCCAQYKVDARPLPASFPFESEGATVPTDSVNVTINGIYIYIIYYNII